MTTAVFGVGHPDRGDDAAGWLVAERLAGSAALVVRRVAADPSMILTDPWWGAADHVVVVDTVRTGAPPGTVHTWELGELLDITVVTGGGTHDLGVAATVALAGALGRLPIDAAVIGIEGCAFAPGTPPCPAVLDAVDRVAALLDVRTVEVVDGETLHLDPAARVDRRRRDRAVTGR
jgi:hydrogenase maturation protease